MRRYKHYSLGFPREDGHVILGYKKRGFGHDLWNGLGGKVSRKDMKLAKEGAGNKYSVSLERECGEEASIGPVLYEKRAILLCGDERDSELIRRVDTYEISRYHGTAVESGEIRPDRFKINGIPYEQMWKMDQFWLPRFLLGEHMLVYAFFDDPESRRLLRFDLHKVHDINGITPNYISAYLNHVEQSDRKALKTFSHK